jgi:hypothetical protein
MCVMVLLEDGGIDTLANPHVCRECMRLRDFLNRFQVTILGVHREKLPSTIGPHCFD